MTITSTYLFWSAIIVVLLGLTHLYFQREHKKRKDSRSAIFGQLYGPGLFSLIVIFFASYLIWQPVIFSAGQALLLVIALPLLIQLILALAMVTKVVSKQERFSRQNHLVPDRSPKVSIILPTYKEPFEVAKMTLDSLTSMKYQGEIVITVVDNSDDYDDLENWRDYVNSQGQLFKDTNTVIHWISRDPDKKGYKPLNLDVAFSQHIAADHDIEYIMYVDTDSTFSQGTLNELIHEFQKTPEIGYIQLMTAANNMDVNKLSKAVGMQQTIFRFVLGEIGNWGIPIFYGHNAMFKRNVVEQVGKFLEKDARGEFILTEDFSITIRSYLKGYYGKTHWLMSGEGVPTSLKALKGMWERWSIGGLQVLKKYMLTALRSDKMNFYEKVSFIFHGLCYPSHAMIPLIILISPLIPQFSILVMALTILNSGLSAIGFKNNFSHLPQGGKSTSATDYLLAFFTINTYITWIMFRSSWKFLFNSIMSEKRRSQMTWIVTPKGREKKISTYSVFRSHLDLIIFAALFTGITCYAFYAGILNTVAPLELLPGLFFIGNLFLTIIAFGQARKAPIIAGEVPTSQPKMDMSGVVTSKKAASIPEIELSTKELI